MNEAYELAVEALEIANRLCPPHEHQQYLAADLRGVLELLVSLLAQEVEGRA